jgi:hypothetical protein
LKEEERGWKKEDGRKKWEERSGKKEVGRRKWEEGSGRKKWEEGSVKFEAFFSSSSQLPAPGFHIHKHYIT